MSRFHTKRWMGMRGRALPSFGTGMTLSFRIKKINIFFFNFFFKKILIVSVSYQKKDGCVQATCALPSFGMTPTQDIRVIFS